MGEVLAQNLQKVGYLGGRMWQALKSRGALVKVAKNKANLATDEVHVENQNYGLGWSESGNNRTVSDC